jgi:hypothetical protein
VGRIIFGRFLESVKVAVKVNVPSSKLETSISVTDAVRPSVIEAIAVPVTALVEPLVSSIL